MHTTSEVITPHITNKAHKRNVQYYKLVQPQVHIRNKDVGRCKHKPQFKLSKNKELFC